jgi:hypothetical protein
LFVEKIHVKYNQSGKVHKVKISLLSNEEGDYVTAEDLVPGSQLILDYGNKPYSVTFIKIDEGQSESTQSAGKCAVRS